MARASLESRMLAIVRWRTQNWSKTHTEYDRDGVYLLHSPLLCENILHRVRCTSQGRTEPSLKSGQLLQAIQVSLQIAINLLHNPTDAAG